MDKPSIKQMKKYLKDPDMTIYPPFKEESELMIEIIKNRVKEMADEIDTEEELESLYSHIIIIYYFSKVLELTADED